MVSRIWSPLLYADVWEGRPASIRWYRNGHNHDKKRHSNATITSFILSCSFFTWKFTKFIGLSIDFSYCYTRSICMRISWMDVKLWNRSMYLIHILVTWNASNVLYLFYICPSNFRLLSCVTEHLTAEIVQMTIPDIVKAIEWMKCSYLYVRMKKVCTSCMPSFWVYSPDFFVFYPNLFFICYKMVCKLESAEICYQKWNF